MIDRVKSRGPILLRSKSHHSASETYPPTNLSWYPLRALCARGVVHPRLCFQLRAATVADCLIS